MFSFLGNRIFLISKSSTNLLIVDLSTLKMKTQLPFPSGCDPIFRASVAGRSVAFHVRFQCQRLCATDVHCHSRCHAHSIRMATQWAGTARRQRWRCGRHTGIGGRALESAVDQPGAGSSCRQLQLHGQQSCGRGAEAGRADCEW